MPNKDYDYANDPAFQSLSAADQHAYLKENVPQYAALDPKTQGEYIASLRGYDQPTQFEKDREQGSGGFLGGLKRFAEGIKPGPLGSIEAGIPAVGAIESAINLIGNAYGRGEREYKADKGMGAARMLGTIAAPIAPAVGIDPDALRQTASTGDRAAVLGQVAIPTAAALAPLAADAVPSRESIAGALRTENGTLKPSVATIGRIGGAAAGAGLGHLVGSPETGALIGGFTGRGIADSIVPRMPDVPELEPEPVVQSLTESPNYARIQAARTMARREAVNAMNPPKTSGGALGRIENGEQLPSVMTIPEPNAPIPGVPEGSMFSVPRAELPSLMKSGTPGADIPYRAAGGKVIFVPRSVIGSK